MPGARSSVLNFDAAKNATVGEGDLAWLTREVEPDKEEAAVPQISAATGSVINSLQRRAQLSMIPDLPRWVEVRSMLLSGGSILGGGGSRDAARCVSFCIEEMTRAGKQPVWGALVQSAVIAAGGKARL